MISGNTCAAAARHSAEAGRRHGPGFVALACLALLGACAPQAQFAATGEAAPHGIISSASDLARLGTVPPPGVQTTGEARNAASSIPAGVGAHNQAALLAFDDAVVRAAEAMLASTRLAPGRHDLVIDPLIDGATGAQTVASRSVQKRIAEVVRRSPVYDLKPFSAASLERKPLVLVGSLMPLRPNNVMFGRPTAYDLWLVLADLRTGRIVGRAESPMRVSGIDPTPTAFFRDSPAWVREDPAQRGYWETCRANVGDPIDSRYVQTLFASALVADGIDAYEAGQPRQALEFYQRAAEVPGGDQMRVHNGLFLANWDLGRRAEAEAAFARVVDLGLRQGQIAVKLLFLPGSTAFWPDPAVSGSYPMLIRRVGQAALGREICLRITGHTSPSGPAAVNEKLSQARAERVQDLLTRAKALLANRTLARGLGAREPIVGTAADDASDTLDRRVEFAPLACGAITASRGEASSGG